MTASEFRISLSSLGLSQVEAARLFGVTDRAVRMWTAGEKPVPRLVALIVGWLCAGKLKLTDLD